MINIINWSQFKVYSSGCQERESYPYEYSLAKIMQGAFGVKIQALNSKNQTMKKIQINQENIISEVARKYVLEIFYGFPIRSVRFDCGRKYFALRLKNDKPVFSIVIVGLDPTI